MTVEEKIDELTIRIEKLESSMNIVVEKMIDEAFIESDEFEIRMMDAIDRLNGLKQKSDCRWNELTRKTDETKEMLEFYYKMRSHFEDSND